MIKMIIAMSVKSSYCLKEILLVVCKFYIIWMHIQRISNSLFLIWRNQGSLNVAIPQVQNPIFWDLKTKTIQIYRVSLTSLSFSKVLFLQRLYELAWDANVSLRISGDKSWWILNISVPKTCKFLWRIETELSLFSSSWKGELSFFVYNLVPSASFRYKRKAKKRPWNTSNTRLKFAQIEGIFFQNKLQNTWTATLKPELLRLQV